MAVDLISSPPGSAGSGDRGSREVAYREAIRAFSDVAVALREVVDRDELLHLAARKMCELVGVSRCSVYLRDDDTGLYRGQVGHADHDIDPMIKRLTGGVEADGFTKEIVRLREPVVINDALRDPRAVRSTMRTWRVRSMMGVPMVLRDEVIGIFFLDSEDKAREFCELDRDLSSAFAELAAVAIYQGELLRELRESSQTVARQNQALRRAAAVDERFTRLVISGGSLREIAEAVTELTSKPCMICDPEMNTLASAAPERGGSAHLVGEDAGLRSQIGAEISRLATDKNSVIGPFPRAGVNVRLLVAPVTVRDGHWASLVLGEVGSPFSNFDLLIGRRVASIIALEMSAERRAALAEWNARASLAAELIRGNRDIAHVERRANFLGVSLDAPHVLALVSWRDGDLQQLPDAEEVVEAVQRVAPGTAVLATGVVEGIALILELPRDEPVAVGVDRIKADLSAAFFDLEPNGRLVGGISMRCLGAEDYVRAYEQARQVVFCIDAYGPPGTIQVLSADDLGPGRLLLAGTDPAEARRFTEESIGPLIEDEAPAELLETLVCFFENGRSVRRSATALEVHENTIRYRLSRIEKLTGMDIAADCSAQLSAQIALLVLRLQGGFAEELQLKAE